MATTPSIHRIVSAPAIWSYGTGDDVSVGSMDSSTRFIPVYQHGPASPTAEKNSSEEEVMQQEDEQAPMNRRGSLNAKPPMNRRRSMELHEVFPSLQSNEEQQPGKASAVWFYGTGDDASVGSDWSARFVRVQRGSRRSMDGDSSINLEQEQNENEGLFSISYSATRSTNRRKSTEFGRKSMDLSQSFPSLCYEEESQNFAIVEESSEHDEEIMEAPLAYPSTSKEKRQSNYSDSWDNLQLTPTDLLSKLMPERFKEAQALISSRKQRAQDITHRAELNNMSSRSDRRSMLEQSLSKMDFSEENADSNHTAKTSLASSWSGSSKNRNQPETSSEDKQKWGLNGLMEHLKEETKKKKKRSSSTKSGPKRCYSCPNTGSPKKDETKAKKRSSSTKVKKVPSLKRSSTCPSSITKLEKKTFSSRSSSNKKKKVPSLKRSSTCPSSITKLEKKTSSRSSVRSKARKRRSDKLKSKDKTSLTIPQRCYSCPVEKPEKAEAKKKKRTSSTRGKKDAPPTIPTRKSSSCPAIAKLAKEERKKKKKSGSSTVRTKDKKLKSKRKSVSKTCSSPPDSEVRAARAA